MEGKLYLIECYKNKKLINVVRFNTVKEVYNFTYKNYDKKYDDFNVYKQEYGELLDYALKDIEKTLKDL